MNEPDDIPVATIQRNNCESLVIEWRKHKAGARFLDVRIYERPRDGTLRPTGRGITIRPGHVEQFLDALIDAETVGRDSGILDPAEKNESAR